LIEIIFLILDYQNYIKILKKKKKNLKIILKNKMEEETNIHLFMLKTAAIKAIIVKLMKRASRLLCGRV
jgi:hypothetical protein